MAVTHQIRGSREPARAPMGISTWMLVLCAILISSDLIAVKAGGFTVRPAYVLMVAVVFFTLPESVGSLDFRWPLGFGSLLLWTVFVLLFIPNTPFLSRSIGYAGWLLLDVLFVFATVQVVNSPAKLKFILRWYALSFGLIAAFGLLQFFLPFIGVAPPLLRQWWIPGVLARVNGLSYEPSYFAGYMVVGVVFVSSLVSYRSALLRRRTLWALVVLTSSVLLVCGSRSGLVILLAWGGWNLARVLGRRRAAFVLLGVLMVLVGAFVVREAQSQRKTAKMLLNGTGLMGTATYSVSNRFERFENTLDVFSSDPFIGVSLGGIIPAIASLHGRMNVHQSGSKRPADQSQGTTAEALAASGIFGFPFYVLYMLGLIWKPRKLTAASPEIRALVNSFIAAMIVMQVQSNILQGYVWLAIALLSACYSVLQTVRTRARPAFARASNAEGAA